MQRLRCVHVRTDLPRRPGLHSGRYAQQGKPVLLRRVRAETLEEAEQPASGESWLHAGGSRLMPSYSSLTNRAQYGFVGYGGRKRAKLAWPLVLVNLSLATLQDTYVGDTLELDLRVQFAGSLRNVCVLIRSPIRPRLTNHSFVASQQL